MKTKPSRLSLMAGGVLLITFALGQRLMTVPTAQIPDTAWLEAHTAELNSPSNAPNIPTDAGQQAAILAAQLLLTINENLLHLPLIIR